MSEADRRYMALALSLASRGLGNVWPNPAVGCVIVNEGRIVGRGWTQPGGRPHAERRALDQAGAAAAGATAYVTLEPCAHHGQTPPCSEALIAAGVARVVSAHEDPDPRVAGRGHALLRAAGVTVETGVMEAEARARVHALRARFDAVLVGGGTARADDPLLTVRSFAPLRPPVRVVAAAHLGLPHGRLAASVPEAPLWLLHGPHAPETERAYWRDLGAEVIEVPERENQLDPEAMLTSLSARGLTRVFCEGGGVFGAALLRAGLVDELIGFTAGVALGGDGRAALGPLRLSHLADAPRFTLQSVETLGGDILHRWRR